MYRLWLCLPLCLLLAPDRPEGTPVAARAVLAADQEPLPEGDPVRFLEKCLERYKQNGIKGYSATFHKQERISGKLQPSEEMEFHYREQPFSVFMRWRQGQRKANAALYVEGENQNQMLANPTGLAGKLVKVAARDPEGEDARQSGRYSIKEAGLKKAAQRSLKSWKAARENGSLRTEYLGVRQVREVGGRLCYTLRRTCAKPEEDGVLEVTLYIDKETWLQVGSVLKGEEGKLIGDYFFREIRLNPPFKPDQFQRSALTP